MNNTQIATRQSVYPAFPYIDAVAAIAWLKSTLGFEEHVVYPDGNGGIAHAQLIINGNLIMLGTIKKDTVAKSPQTLGGASGGVYIAFDTVAEVDAVYARAKAAGAQFTRELNDTDYGSHEFGVRDPEGQLWSFGTYRPQATDAPLPA
jgi:uncharacterized glyoxalase superfamily protein PhnB